MELPSLMKAEVKLTTGVHVSVTRRELDALDVASFNEAGIVASLFVGGEPEADAQWLIVDASAWRGRCSESVSITRAGLVALARQQSRLDALRTHVDGLWPSFLEGWADVVAYGHEELLAELNRAHREGTLGDRLPRHEVLAIEHRATFAALVDRHGEQEAGRLAQDLLAYLVAFAGYARVTNNPIGVPDFVLERRNRSLGSVTVTLRQEDVERLLDLCARAGAADLVGRLEEGRRFMRAV